MHYIWPTTSVTATKQYLQAKVLLQDACPSAHTRSSVTDRTKSKQQFSEYVQYAVRYRNSGYGEGVAEAELPPCLSAPTSMFRPFTSSQLTVQLAR